MRPTLLSRRTLAFGLAALPIAAGSRARTASPAAGTAVEAPDGVGNGLTHDAESIHQELSFAAHPAAVYEALTDAAKFDAVTRLSDAVTLVTAPHAQATAISTELGGTFVLFGGYITGRHVEMVPGVRLVQAWRAGSWKAGDYSIVNFSLAAQGDSCRLSFDHRGFPQGQGPSLAYGWRVHYWEPLAKLLGGR